MINFLVRLIPTSSNPSFSYVQSLLLIEFSLSSLPIVSLSSHFIPCEMKLDSIEIILTVEMGKLEHIGVRDCLTKRKLGLHVTHPYLPLSQLCQI